MAIPNRTWDDFQAERGSRRYACVCCGQEAVPARFDYWDQARCAECDTHCHDTRAEPCPRRKKTEA